jgi:hypothetical protein
VIALAVDLEVVLEEVSAALWSCTRPPRCTYLDVYYAHGIMRLD